MDVPVSGREVSSQADGSRSIRLVIVDDHPLVRQSLQFALLSSEDIEVVGEAVNGEEAISVCGTLHPDVVLMDLRLPGLSSAEAIRELKRQQPTPQVLVLTADIDERLMPEALAAGACG